MSSMHSYVMSESLLDVVEGVRSNLKQCEDSYDEDQDSDASMKPSLTVNIETRLGRRLSRVYTHCPND